MSHEHEIISAVDDVIGSVVSIVVSKHADVVMRTLPFDGIQAQLPADENGNIKIGGGSGFLISNDGLILTNKHVIMDPDAEYTILDQAGTKAHVKILARDPIHDVAILRTVPTKHMKPAKLGKSQNLKLGQTVIAIGNALGEFQSSVSTGVVSGLSRMIAAVSDMTTGHQERLRGLIQTDAAINPGNSGGPLINIHGEVIGINSAVVFGAQNIGFAIPIEKASRDLHDLSEYGRIRRPFIGVRYVLLNRQLQQKLGLPVDYGAMVIREPIPGDHAVIPHSPAERAGVREKDIIISCNGSTINEKNTLEDILENVNVDDSVRLTLLRDNEKHTLTLALREWKPLSVTT